MRRTKDGPDIGAHRVKSDVAQIEQAGKPDHDVQAQGQGHVDANLGGDFQVVGVTNAKQRQ